MYIDFFHSFLSKERRKSITVYEMKRLYPLSRLEGSLSFYPGFGLEEIFWFFRMPFFSIQFCIICFLEVSWKQKETVNRFSLTFVFPFSKRAKAFYTHIYAHHHHSRSLSTVGCVEVVVVVFCVFFVLQSREREDFLGRGENLILSHFLLIKPTNGKEVPQVFGYTKGKKLLRRINL